MTKQTKTEIVQAVEQVTHAGEQDFGAFFDAMGLGQPQFTWQRTLCTFLVGAFAGSGVAVLSTILLTAAVAAVLPLSAWLAMFVHVFGWALALLATFYASSRAAQWYLTGGAADVIEDAARVAKNKVTSFFKRSKKEDEDCNAPVALVH